MKNKTVLKVVGISLFLLGKILILSYFIKITGHVVSDIPKPVGSLMGVVLIICGLFIFIAGLEKKIK